MTHWNYRVLAHESGDSLIFRIHEVYYDDNDIPNGYIDEEKQISSEDLKGLKWTINKMKEAFKKPVLWHGAKFPEEFKDKPLND